MPGDLRNSADEYCPSLVYKLDLFMRSHVLPSFQPERIRWWLSLSGGKDSFAMAHALRNWYRVSGLHFDSVLFNIDQWHGDAAAAIKRQISWEDVQVIEANELTLRQTK